MKISWHKTWRFSRFFFEKKHEMFHQQILEPQNLNPLNSLELFQTQNSNPPKFEKFDLITRAKYRISS